MEEKEKKGPSKRENIYIYDNQGAAFFKHLVMMGHRLLIKEHDVFRRFDCLSFSRELYKP